MDKIVNFQIEEALPEWLEDYSEEKFTVFKTCFLSTSRNSHHFDISEEVLKRDASTILGNFLVAKVNKIQFNLKFLKILNILLTKRKAKYIILTNWKILELFSFFNKTLSNKCSI